MLTPAIAPATAFTWLFAILSVPVSRSVKVKMSDGSIKWCIELSCVILDTRPFSSWNVYHQYSRCASMCEWSISINLFVLMNHSKLHVRTTHFKHSNKFKDVHTATIMRCQSGIYCGTFVHFENVLSVNCISNLCILHIDVLRCLNLISVSNQKYSVFYIQNGLPSIRWYFIIHPATPIRINVYIIFVPIFNWNIIIAIVAL